MKVPFSFQACWMPAADSEEQVRPAGLHTCAAMHCYFACVTWFTAHSQWAECNPQREECVEIQGVLSKLSQFPEQNLRPRVLKGLVQGHTAHLNTTRDSASWPGVLSGARILSHLLPPNRSDFAVFALPNSWPAKLLQSQGESHSLQTSLLPSCLAQSLL